MYAELSPDKSSVLISFRYDPRLVAAVKALTGRAFDPARKRWTVPADHADEAVTKLTPLGFSCSPELKAKARELQAAALDLEAIRAGGADYAGSLPLFGFQKIGAAFLRRASGAILGDEMGLGKTMQVIASLEDCPGPILVITPSSLKYGWADEIVKWTALPESVMVIDGSKSERRDQWNSGAFKWFIMNYELLLRSDLEEVRAIPWAAIVCDEATRISNGENKTTKALKTVRAAKKIALTGTPISNSPLDVWSVADWARPGFLGSFWHFRAKYALTEDDGFGHERVVGFKDLGDLRARLAPMMLRRTKPEVLHDFPAKTSQLVKFDLSKEEKKLYGAIKAGVAAELGNMKLAGKTDNLHMALVKLLRLKQATGHPALVGESDMESSKLSALRDILRPVLESGEKAIVFTQFAEMAGILCRSMPGARVWMIRGDVASEDRQQAVREFTAWDGPAVMVMTEAGAYGLNLQAACYVVHYDLPWSIAKMRQREDRAYRIGQTKPVTVFSLVAKNTVDEYVVSVLHAKAGLAEAVLGDEERIEMASVTMGDVDEMLK